jgi:hypothetical protein
MSDTPRTDEQINGKPCTRFEILAGDSLRNAAVPSEFARTIERELNAANERIKRLEEAGDALCAAAAFMGWHMEIEKWNKSKEAKP